MTSRHLVGFAFLVCCISTVCRAETTSRLTLEIPCRRSPRPEFRREGRHRRMAGDRSR